MAIKKITSIKNLGIFSDFSWQNCQDFKKYNFFYGWNYSGKTTLSRLFRCLEEKKIHPDYTDLQYKIETDIGNISERDIQSNNLIVRVFNEEYVEKNFKWNDENHRINPVLILGKESIELNQKLDSKEKEKKEKEEEKIKFENEINTLSRQLDSSLTGKASEIRKLLNITNQREFDKSILENKIIELKDNYKSFILKDDDVQRKLNIYRNQRTYEAIAELRFDLKINDLINKVSNVLSKKITAQQVIQKLKENPALNKWVREGIDLHINETKCQFCGNDLPSELFERLNKHFSHEFDQLMNDINSLIDEINNYKNYIERKSFTDKARFYDEIQNEYETEKNNLIEQLNVGKEKLKILLNKLDEKKNKPFDVIEQVSIENIDENINKIMNKLNEIIKKNNDKINGLEKEKGNIKDELIKHYSAKAIEEIEYFSKKNEIENKEKELQQTQQNLVNILKEIEDIKKKIIKANVGAEKIHTYLKEFFSDDHLRLVILEDGTYQIYRNNTIAKNLSTGEKNIIVLIYFITKLEEANFNLNNAIIFIDDPVSSLDSNHIFKVYGFLSEKILNCKQLFITTHNFDFFNLLKDLIKSDPDGITNRQTKKEKENFYLIRKISINNQRYSVIEDLPEILKNFKSEYNYLFFILKKFNDSSDKNNFEFLYLLPNIARRFLEAYLYQRYPDGKKFKDKCENFFKEIDRSKKLSILKMIDEYSHEENPEHSKKFPDIEEVIDNIKSILGIIEQRDKEHYEALCSAINK